MNRINFSEINFNKLEKLKSQGTKSTIYRDGNSCIKILDGLYESEKMQLFQKINDMSGINIPHVLFPKELIMKDDKLYGYIMDYFEDSMSIFDKFLTRYVNCSELFDCISKANEILKDIHKNNIIVQDLSFDNILVDNNGSVAFCDLDGCSYGKHVSPFISMLLKSFYVDYRKQEIPFSKNTDRISMMISFFYLVYLCEIQNINSRQYHKLSNKVNTLDKLSEYANMLVDKNVFIGDIPYLDEIIDSNDDYIIDRYKYLNLKQKINMTVR